MKKFDKLNDAINPALGFINTQQKDTQPKTTQKIIHNLTLLMIKEIFLRYNILKEQQSILYFVKNVLNEFN